MKYLKAIGVIIQRIPVKCRDTVVPCLYGEPHDRRVYFINVESAIKFYDLVAAPHLQIDSGLSGQVLGAGFPLRESAVSLVKDCKDLMSLI